MAVYSELAHRLSDLLFMLVNPRRHNREMDMRQGTNLRNPLTAPSTVCESPDIYYDMHVLATP